MSLKKRALYQGTALAVPIGKHFLGFSTRFSSPGAHPLHPLERAGAKAQCRILFRNLRIRGKWWGGPPGPRGSPWTRFSSRGSSDCQPRQAGQGAGCGPGGPPHHLSRCPEICGIGLKPPGSSLLRHGSSRALIQCAQLRDSRGTLRTRRGRNASPRRRSGREGRQPRRTSARAARPRRTTGKACHWVWQVCAERVRFDATHPR
jgi:hypothetical protein